MALSSLRWTASALWVALGVGATFIPALMLRDRWGGEFALLAPMAAGGLLGLLVIRLYWRRKMVRLCDSFIRLDEECLEIKGAVPEGTWHVRFHLKQIASIQIGEDRLVGLLSPLIAALDSSTLAIRMKSGSSAKFLMVGLLYRREDLAALFSALKPKLGLQ